MGLHNLKPAKGSTRNRKRVGRGPGSGLGKTAGRGEKGQKSRSGFARKPGFEGGQMPLHRRLPKKGFSNVAFRDTVAVVNVSQLEAKFDAGATVDQAALREAGLIQGRCAKVKVLGNGDLGKKLKVRLDLASTSAREKIEKAGGSFRSPE